MRAPTGVAISAVASVAASPAPASNPYITGRVVCDSINCVTFCEEAPSAIRTPISLVRCSTRYDSTLNSPDTVSNSASPPRISDTQKAIRRKNVSSLATRPHGHDHAHVRIDPGEMVDECLPGQVGIAVDARDDRRLRRVKAGRHETCPHP